MGKVICFANNKGGSGKSTSCSNIAVALAKEGKKVLCIDGDMQLNLTLAFCDEERAMQYATSDNNIYGVLIKDVPASECIYQTDIQNVYLLPSNTLMSGAEYELFTKWQRETVLSRALKGVIDDYDYVLIDAPPTLGCVVMNLLATSDRVIIPLEASPWGLFGLANMFDFVQSVKSINPQLEILGVLITKVDTRKNYYKQTIQNLAEAEIPTFNTVIRTDSNIEWAQDRSTPVVAFKPSCRSSKEYLELANEIINKF